ncbi:MAG TPA: ABC transporter ATP-binding protein [Chloroflexia bacterium]|nr:ABC transporter ATP-binding protein [Chloroflexia bacterium]
MSHAINAVALGRQFEGRWAVADLDLSVEQGEVFGLLGPNGAGKTTTMRMLSCLIAPTVGSATVCGFDIHRQRTEVRRSIGILTESPGLYESLTAQQNLEFYAKIYDIEPQRAAYQIERYLSLLGLWERRKDRAGGFSKGMKQKLSMARALLHEPPLIILDEPTSALDPEGAKMVRDFIGELKGEGRTIILCTHNLFEAQGLCDRVAIIKRKLLRVGTPRDLQRSLFGRHVEVRIANASQTPGEEQYDGENGIASMNDLAVFASGLEGVGDVVVNGDRLIVSSMDPDEITPGLVRALVEHGAEILRVAEVEHTLEMAYLDLVARQDQFEAEEQALLESVAS